MPAARKAKASSPMLQLEIDDRTQNMSDEALMCRTFGHKWERRALSRSQALELIKQGLIEHFRFCGHGCGSTWRQVWDIRRKEVVENKRSYPTNNEYLVPKGGGRLPRREAFAANFAREYRGLV